MTAALLNRFATPTDCDPLTVPVIVPLGATAATLKAEEMFHPTTMFTDPDFATLSLRDLARAFDTWQAGRSSPIKPVSRRKYQYSLNQLIAFMEQEGIPTQLRYLHPATIDRWIAEKRSKGQSEDGIGSTLVCVKVFSNQFCVKQRDLCLSDPLRKVSRITAPEKEIEVLTPEEIDAVLGAFGDITFEDIRNRAFLAVMLATGARLREVRELKMDAWDAGAARLTFMGKGDRIRYGVLGERALKFFQRYLRMRPRHTSNMIWLQRDGAPIGEAGWQTMFRRLKINSGVSRVRAHLLRHTFGSMAIMKGAERAAVQDMLGHQTDLMSRRYARNARKQTAAAMMPQYAPI